MTAPSVPFLNTVSQKLSYFGALQRKVQHLKSDAVKISPKESELIATLERLIRRQDYYEMVKLWEAVPSDDLAHENPKLGRCWDKLMAVWGTIIVRRRENVSNMPKAWAILTFS